MPAGGRGSSRSSDRPCLRTELWGGTRRTRASRLAMDGRAGTALLLAVASAIVTRMRGDAHLGGSGRRLERGPPTRRRPRLLGTCFPLSLQLPRVFRSCSWVRSCCRPSTSRCRCCTSSKRSRSTREEAARSSCRSSALCRSSSAFASRGMICRHAVALRLKRRPQLAGRPLMVEAGGRRRGRRTIGATGHGPEDALQPAGLRQLGLWRRHCPGLLDRARLAADRCLGIWPRPRAARSWDWPDRSCSCRVACCCRCWRSQAARSRACRLRVDIGPARPLMLGRGPADAARFKAAMLDMDGIALTFAGERLVHQAGDRRPEVSRRCGPPPSRVFHSRVLAPRPSPVRRLVVNIMWQWWLRLIAELPRCMDRPVDRDAMRLDQVPGDPVREPRPVRRLTARPGSRTGPRGRPWPPSSRRRHWRPGCRSAPAARPRSTTGTGHAPTAGASSGMTMPVASRPAFGPVVMDPAFPFAFDPVTGPIGGGCCGGPTVRPAEPLHMGRQFEDPHCRLPNNNGRPLRTRIAAPWQPLAMANTAPHGRAVTKERPELHRERVRPFGRACRKWRSPCPAPV